MMKQNNDAPSLPSPVVTEEVKEQINAIATQTASSLTGELAGSLDLARLMLEFKKNQVVEVLSDPFSDERLKNDRELLLNPETRG